MSDTPLPMILSANSNSQFRMLTRTVEEAIDAIQQLPDGIRFQPHWIKAEDAMFVVVDGDNGASAVGDAGLALLEGLTAEGWLRSAQPA